jgi:hypothetical protein
MIETPDPNTTSNYLGVMIWLLICYLLGPTSLWADLPIWSLILSSPLVRVKIEVSSLALNTSSNLVNFGSQSGYRWTGNHRSDTSIRTKLINYLWYNSCFIFMCGFLLHWCRRVDDVFNMKRSPYDFNFCLLYVEISLVDNRTSFNRKKSFISCIALSWLPSFSGELWPDQAWSRLCASLSLKLQSCPEVTWNQSDTCSDRHILLYDAALSFKEIDGFIAHLFDRGVPTARPSSVSMPYSSNNSPPLVRVLDFFNSFPDLWSYESILIIH